MFCETNADMQERLRSCVTCSKFLRTAQAEDDGHNAFGQQPLYSLAGSMEIVVQRSLAREAQNR